MQERSSAQTATGDDAARHLDVVIAADMTVSADRCLRIAEEVRDHARSGKTVGLLQQSAPTPGARIAPEVQTCVRRGLAQVIDATNDIEAELLVIHGASEIDWRKKRLSRIHARQAVIVCHSAADYGTARLRQTHSRWDKVVWAPINPAVRDAAPRGVELAATDWQPVVHIGASMRPPRRTGLLPRIGWIGGEDQALPNGDQADIVPLGEGMLFDVSLDRLMQLDAIAHFPSSEFALNETIARAALVCEVPIALPQWAKTVFGKGPIYCELERAGERLRAAIEKRTPLKIGGTPEPHGGIEDAVRPIMLVASNGVGVGHVNRLLAIARRIDKRRPIVFVTQAQAVGAIERLGYRAEYLPSAHYVGGDFAQWDRWFRYELETLIDGYDPALVVYDGNNPSDGLVRAVISRRDCRLAWVRRGLWGDLTSPFITNSSWFDMIVEPGEIEGQPDNGITARRRAEALVVPPIRLLEDSELLPRSEAAAALGLDPGRPAALIQLGAGYNRDLIKLIDQLVGALRQAPQLQICIAEWVNGEQPIGYWPDVIYLRGYPLSQYFRAFDFSIAAAGYNTFHEVIAFGLPTIFVPNRHPSMDDQAGRAEHAQALEAGFELSDDDLSDLPDLVTLLMDKKAREFLAVNERKLAQENGASHAATAFEHLLERCR